MSSTTVSAPQLNGDSAVTPETLREAQFLEKLLQIRDEVLAGKHPRIQLPPSVLEKVAPRPTQPTPPVSHKPTTNGTPNGSQSLQLFPPRPESSLQQHQFPNEYSTPTAQNAPRPFSAKSASSGIDPILLTKSDHLIRAEMQLKRQQIERSLRDQFDKKGLEDRESASFDVDELLARAHESVKPFSGLPTTIHNSEGSESFDENSYYSSQANSWSSEEIDRSHNANGANAAELLTSQANRSAATKQLTAAAPTVRAQVPSKQGEPTVIDLEDEPYEPADDIEIYEPEPARAHDEQEESDYSPPPADVGLNESNRGRGRGRGHEANGGPNGSSGQSPAGNPPPLQNTRKRRREEKKRQQANKRVARSPQPYIKEEPQSPPPFASYPDSQPSKRRALQPLPHDIEVVSAREGRIQPVYHREQDHSPRSLRQYEEPSSPSVIRVPQRRLERDDQDLRRVASLHYARRPYSPDSYSAPEPRQIRAASHTVIERPEPLYREGSSRPSAAPRYLRERSRSPIHEYVPRAQSPAIMAPPPRRIVVDQYGQKYYAAPVDVRDSIAPPSRREADPYYERAATREPTMRAPARVELYEEDDQVRMPPPPARRYVEAPEAEMLEGRPYRPREASHRPMEMEYSPREASARRPVIEYEEMGPPREYIHSRAYSVRPDIVRRDMPGDFTPVRHESVQPRYVSVAAPRYREVSVVHPEAYDERRYQVAPAQGRRYVDEGALERPVDVVQEPYREEPRRVSYRY